MLCEAFWPVEPRLPALADDLRRSTGSRRPPGRRSLRRPAGPAGAWSTGIGAGAARPPLPACVCVAFWVVVAELPDVAVEPAVLACDTEPSSPGLSTRIETLVFDG